MSSSDSSGLPQLEDYRSYLRLLARIQMPRQVAARMDASDIVQQTMIQANGALGNFRGRTREEFAGAPLAAVAW
jgi:RNA polymerase sigma-70 factor, ECF subfamily